MPEKIDLGHGEWIVIRDLNGQDRKEFLIRAEKRRRAKGPAVILEADPADPAATREVPNPDAEFGIGDNYEVIDDLAGRVIESWSFPGGMPYTAEHRQFIPLKCDEAFTEAIVRVINELTGDAGGGDPKEKVNGSSSTTSPGEAENPLTEQAAETSSTPSGS